MLTNGCNFDWNAAQNKFSNSEMFENILNGLNLICLCHTVKESTWERVIWKLQFIVLGSLGSDIAAAQKIFYIFG